jgi:hypothetical protein
LEKVYVDLGLSTIHVDTASHHSPSVTYNVLSCRHRETVPSGFPLGVSCLLDPFRMLILVVSYPNIYIASRCRNRSLSIHIIKITNMYMYITATKDELNLTSLHIL